jgi:cyanophycin synthetase
MRIVEVRRLRGPNLYCSSPVVTAVLDLQELAGQETTDVPGFTARVLELLPGLADHHCAASRRCATCPATNSR